MLWDNDNDTFGKVLLSTGIIGVFDKFAFMETLETSIVLELVDRVQDVTQKH